MNRRYFIQSMAAGALAMRRSMPASDKVNLAVMGVRGRGRGLTSDFAELPDARIAYLCDVDENVFGPALKIAQAKGFQPKLIADIRRALDDKSVDAIVMATPDHWHAPGTILACEAGKDVYVEKPAAHNLREGRMMVEAARRSKRIVQHGTQARSRASTRKGIEYIQSGKIGKVLMAKAWNVQLRENIGRKKDSPIPKGVDYDTWTGPALMLPFNENRYHYQWHWHWNYGTGDMGNDGVHQLDIARWALGVDYPTEVTGMGRKLFFDDDQQTPDTMSITFNYPDKVMMFEMRIWNSYAMDGIENGVAVYGTEGMVHLERGFKVFDGKGKLVLTEEATPDTHARNFIDCIRNRKAPNAEIEIGHISTLHCHLGNIVARTGRPLKFDSRSETVIADEEAKRLLGREYRQHWATPRSAVKTA
jgi:predicted dehydrogenase